MIDRCSANLSSVYLLHISFDLVLAKKDAKMAYKLARSTRL